MKRRRRFKSRKKKKQSNLMFITIVSILIFLIIAFYIMTKSVSSILIPFAEVQTKKIANLVINSAINKHITDEFPVEDMYTIIKDNDGKIVSVTYNTKEINVLMNRATSTVQVNLKAIEEGNIDYIDLPDDIIIEYDPDNLRKGIIYKIPLGAISKNAFLSNLGPKIPVRLQLVGSVVSGFKTNVKAYGINNALIELSLHMTVEEMVILPLVSQKVEVSTVIPIDIKIITGEVPKYFQNGETFSSPMFSFPVE